MNQLETIPCRICRELPTLEWAGETFVVRCANKKCTEQRRIVVCNVPDPVDFGVSQWNRRMRGEPGLLDGLLA